MVVYIEEDHSFAISLKDEFVYVKAHTGEELMVNSQNSRVLSENIFITKMIKQWSW